MRRTKNFLDAAKRSHNYNQYALILQTGLRHTYATRAIESGMKPKLLQQLLAHASIKTTMDRYVHVTEDSLANAVNQFENHFS